jgi:hypothetical protein
MSNRLRAETLIPRNTGPALVLACFMRLQQQANLARQAMRLSTFVHINYAPVTAVLLSVLGWVALYSVYANFGQLGFELLQGPGVLLNVGGMVLVGLHASGLLLLLGLGLGAITVLTKTAARAEPREDRSEISPTR